jgi:hypothetical protein
MDAAGRNPGTTAAVARAAIHRRIEDLFIGN